MEERVQQRSDEPTSFSQSLEALNQALACFPELNYSLFGRGTSSRPLPSTLYKEGDEKIRRLARAAADMRAALATAPLDGVTDVLPAQALSELAVLLEACDVFIDGQTDHLLSIRYIQPPLVVDPPD